MRNHPSHLEALPTRCQQAFYLKLKLTLLNLGRRKSASLAGILQVKSRVNAVSRLIFIRMQENIQSEIQSKNTENAVLTLQKLATNLLSVAEYELAQDVLNEAEHVRLHQDHSKRGKKQIKYGTRALIVSAINQTTDTLIK